MTELPPPDPCEHAYPEPTGAALPEPLAIFPFGPPAPRVEAFANAILDARPGLLIIVTRA
jgi:hypothetical protein